MGQPSDPKRSPSAARRAGIEDWLAERLARTLGENPDEDLDDIDEIVELDPLDDPGPNVYDDEADTTRRRIAVVGGPPPKSVGYPVAGRGGRPADESPMDEQSADPDEYATVIAADAPASASSAEAPTVYADGPQFQTSQVFEIVEPAPGEITKPIPPDADRPEVWDLLGDNTSATVAETPADHGEPRFAADDPTVVAVQAEVVAESTAPVHMDEIIDEIDPEPLDSIEYDPWGGSAPLGPPEGPPLPVPDEAPSAEIAMPAAEAPSPLEPTATGYGGQRPPAELPREPMRPVLANTSFSSRNAEDPHTTWSAVEVADGAPPPSPLPMPIPLAMPEPSLKATPARTATPIPAAPVTPPAMVSWMPALPVPLRDAETEIRPHRADDDPPTVAPAQATVSVQPADGPPTLHLAEAPTSASAEALAETVEAVPERVEPKHEADIVDPAPLSLPALAGGRASDPGTAPVAAAPSLVARASDPVSGPRGDGPDLAVDAARVPAEGFPTEPAIPAALVFPGPPPAPPGIVPVRTPIQEARVEGTVTEHGFADLGGSVQTWLAAAFGLVTAVVFVGMMGALILWFQVGTGP